MTGPLQGFSPSTRHCRASKCDHLQPYRTDVVGKKERVSYWCDLAEKIPGNMGQCPLDVPEEIDEMKVLSFRQPIASMAAEGIMVLNIRPTDCHYRGPVAIYAIQGHVRRRDRKYFEKVLGREIFKKENGKNKSLLPHGKIIAVADITDTIRFDNPDKFDAYSECHYLSPFYFEKGMVCYGLVLKNIRPLTAEIGWKMPKGCRNWSKIRTSVINPYLPAVAEVMV
ncbi:hypothetical protein MettiDRAFT_0825 [Methanolobus tindarius DSM 2278]|uniref:Uncharacterized protein n=1 Tax=Methanolobus tindarius DSM 2278 TaxID=1090322 RepID=W9DVE5_METTI|nr:hypothetical protein [Methanolobus tindarius]ETA67401.1 hypothetical protein MettiDRAFT_0825 [Methanolobus tindarius DSM 2278]